MITQVNIDPATRAWLVRRLVDWGYLDGGDCIEDDDDFESRCALGNAISRALPRLILEGERKRDNLGRNGR